MLPLCKSIVSTELVTKIAESYGATMFNVLTGFKFIGEKSMNLKHNTTHLHAWFRRKLRLPDQTIRT